MSTHALRTGKDEARAALPQIWACHRDDVLGHVAVLEDAVAALMEGSLSASVRREAEQRARTGWRAPRARTAVGPCTPSTSAW